jgi:hypothetical protein
MEIGQQVFGKVGNKTTTRNKTLTFWKVGDKVGNKAAKARNKDRKEEGNNTRQQVFGLGTR